MMARDQVLLLLNVRLEWLLCEHGAADAIEVLRRVLDRARVRGWEVLHAHHPNPTAQKRGAIKGLEPHAGEPLIALTRQNAFGGVDESTLRGRTVYLAGSVFSRAGLATALAAADLGCAIAFVDDAVLASAEAPWVRPKMAPPVIWPVQSSVLFDDDRAVVNFVSLRHREKS